MTAQIKFHKFQYFYKERLPEGLLKRDQVLELYIAGRDFGITGFSQHLEAYLEPFIGMQTVVGTLELSSLLRFNKLQAAAWDYIEKRTWRVFQVSKDALSETTLGDILDNDHLNIREIELFGFVKT
jgi:hypothetical protein